MLPAKNYGREQNGNMIAQRTPRLGCLTASLLTDSNPQTGEGRRGVGAWGDLEWRLMAMLEFVPVPAIFRCTIFKPHVRLHRNYVGGGHSLELDPHSMVCLVREAGILHLDFSSDICSGDFALRWCANEGRMTRADHLLGNKVGDRDGIRREGNCCTASRPWAGLELWAIASTTEEPTVCFLVCSLHIHYARHTVRTYSTNPAAFYEWRHIIVGF